MGISNSSVVYVLYIPVTDTSFYTGLFRSSDVSLNFTRQGRTPNILGGADNGQDAWDQSGYDHGIAVDPTNSNNIITAGLTIWSSSNAGT